MIPHSGRIAPTPRASQSPPLVASMRLFVGQVCNLPGAEGRLQTCPTKRRGLGRGVAGGVDPVTVEAFYDQLAPFYHLIFPDWEASIQRQAAAVDAIVRQRWGEARLDILDVACGIGTQALGLAALGHRVTGSDLSAAAIERARREAKGR